MVLQKSALFSTYIERFKIDFTSCTFNGISYLNPPSYNWIESSKYEYTPSIMKAGQIDRCTYTYILFPLDNSIKNTLHRYFADWICCNSYTSISRMQFSFTFCSYVAFKYLLFHDCEK